MSQTTETFVNFSRNRLDAGIYSQFSPELIRLDLAPVRTRLVNMRSMSPAPSLDREGFALVNHPLAGDWQDSAWLNGAYVESCLDLVKSQSGASVTINMYFPIVRSVDPREGAIQTADFIHIDQDRAGYAAQGAARARECGYEMKRGAIYNVWKALSPPPQDRPLAIANICAFDPGEFVPGMNVEAGGGGGAPFFGIAEPTTQPSMHYVPDLDPDESLVFIAGDFDPRHPLGCAHTAIQLSGVDHQLVPRVSVEMRVLALFD